MDDIVWKSTKNCTITGIMLYDNPQLPWWKRIIRRITRKPTGTPIAFFRVPPGYPDDMYELSVTVEDGIIKIGDN